MFVFFCGNVITRTLVGGVAVFTTASAAHMAGAVSVPWFPDRPDSSHVVTVADDAPTVTLSTGADDAPTVTLATGADDAPTVTLATGADAPVVTTTTAPSALATDTPPARTVTTTTPAPVAAPAATAVVPETSAPPSPTAAPTTAQPPSTAHAVAPSTSAGPPTPAEERVLQALDAGTVVVRISGAQVTVVSTSPAPGWAAEVDATDPAEGDVTFASGPDRVDLTVEVDDGEVRVRVRDRRLEAG